MTIRQGEAGGPKVRRPQTTMGASMSTHRLRAVKGTVGGIGLLVMILAPTLAHSQAPTGPSKPGQTRTTLSDGRVLIIGGLDATGPLKRASILDPVTQAETVLGTGLQTPRHGHTATVLPDGTVLVFGGVGVDGRPTASPEVFDPSAGTSAPFSDPGFQPRAYHSATLLTDGRVLFAGGIGADRVVQGTSQLWRWQTR